MNKMSQLERAMDWPVLECIDVRNPLTEFECLTVMDSDIEILSDCDEYMNQQLNRALLMDMNL